MLLNIDKKWNNLLSFREEDKGIIWIFEKKISIENFIVWSPY